MVMVVIVVVVVVVESRSLIAKRSALGLKGI